MIEIIPSILTNDPDELRDMLAQAEGAVDRVHIDIIDGIYADNKTIDPTALNKLDTFFNIDFHLMVNNPENWIEKCVRAGASRVISQIEMMQNQSEFVDKVLSAGVYVGLAIDNDSSVFDLDSEILSSLDVILIMSVPAGFGGQKFNLNTLEKIYELKVLREKYEYKYKISVDGGITPQNISKIIKEGADEATVGRWLFEGNIKENIEKFT